MAVETLVMRAAVLSERGRRRDNEDAALAVVLSDGAELVAVADGMGGYAGGSVASRHALEALQGRLEQGAGLEEAVRAANHAVYVAANGDAGRASMGTTLVALLRRGNSYHIANVGDSRAYRIDAHAIEQITEDHSFIAEAVRSGLLSAEEAGRSRWRNAVTRAVGTDPELEAVDCFGPFDATELHTVLLCTDGLYRSLSAERLQTAHGTATAAAAAGALVSAAYEAGSDDNISIAVIRFGSTQSGSLRAEGPGASPGAASEAREAAPAESLRAPAAAAPGHVSGWGIEPAEQAPSRAARRRRGRGRRRHHNHRWTTIEVAVLALGFVAVAAYVAMLLFAF